MDTVGTFEMAKALSNRGMLTCIHKYYSTKDWLKTDIDFNHTIPSIGVKREDLTKFKKIYKDKPTKFLCIDVANGYGEYLPQHIKKIRKLFPDIILIAGNVVTADMTQELILAGADIVKIGIGPGMGCSTTDVTGIGYPQLSAVIDCADAAHGLGGHIISDGGCKKFGDIIKAFAGGADFVMLGGMLAGHDEGLKENDIIIDKSGKKFIKFYGMSSRFANEKYNGGMKDYRASEGKEIMMPVKGPVDETLLEMMGAMRSACTYLGAKRLKEIPRRATFIKRFR
jgi:GMP reductase